VLSLPSVRSATRWLAASCLPGSLPVSRSLFLYTVSQKKNCAHCPCYFLNNFVKRWGILIIFDTKHTESTCRKWPQFCSSYLYVVATVLWKLCNVGLSRYQHNYYHVYIQMMNWIATNTTASLAVVTSHKSHT